MTLILKNLKENVLKPFTTQPHLTLYNPSESNLQNSGQRELQNSGIDIGVGKEKAAVCVFCETIPNKMTQMQLAHVYVFYTQSAGTYIK